MTFVLCSLTDRLETKLLLHQTISWKKAVTMRINQDQLNTGLLKMLSSQHRLFKRCPRVLLEALVETKNRYFKLLADWILEECYFTSRANPLPGIPQWSNFISCVPSHTDYERSGNREGDISSICGVNMKEQMLTSQLADSVMCSVLPNSLLALKSGRICSKQMFAQHSWMNDLWLHGSLLL